MVDAGALGSRDRPLQRHRLRVTEVEPLERLGHDDGRSPVRREVHVVRVVHSDGRARLARDGVDRRQGSVGAVLGIVGHPQGREIPGGDDVLRVHADGEPVDDLERRRIDHGHIVGLEIRHVHARQRLGDRRAQLVGRRLAVEIGRVDHRRHAGHRLDGHRGPGRGRAEGQCKHERRETSHGHVSPLRSID